ncbi:NAD(P)-dependent oxidoreductase [Pseudonocardia sp. MH-G8]|uniref:NAD(P)-dependent oxidoreductase n=1 Tax=Pseudonocardia sp. MH-G8 TaxID=1854588 RepID=UPI000B9FF75D|nr:NAD(P)H-binding protein [Pseudonocardia sp. MH-G8]OZM81684.1 NADH-flavin reductase [Pseudonocardia sp. MH-G8]
MQITVIGATGMVGRRVVAEALARGHSLTAVVRDTTRAADLPPAVRVRAGDAADVVAVACLAADQDVVVASIRPAVGSEAELVPTTQALLAGLVGSGARLLVVGGAGSLVVPGTGGLVADDPSLVTGGYRAIALAGVQQLAACRAAPDEVDWTYLSPPAELVPGVRTRTYRRGTDELLLDTRGRSRISVEDLAVALLDEAQNPAHRRTRFTVAY